MSSDQSSNSERKWKALLQYFLFLWDCKNIIISLISVWHNKLQGKSIFDIK